MTLQMNEKQKHNIEDVIESSKKNHISIVQGNIGIIIGGIAILTSGVCAITTLNKIQFLVEDGVKQVSETKIAMKEAMKAQGEDHISIIELKQTTKIITDILETIHKK
jgi:hypothetical protein